MSLLLYIYLKYCVVFLDVHIPGTVSKNTSSWDVSERGANADMHCGGSRDLGWRETRAGVYHPVITATAVLTVLLKDQYIGFPYIV